MSVAKKTHRVAGRPVINSADRHVVRQGSGWIVKTAGAARASSLHESQAAAERAAREMVSRQGGGQVVVHGRDGRIRESFTLGREAFAKVSEVERIHLTPEMQREFREFDRRGLSAGERRRRIAKKYGAKAT